MNCALRHEIGEIFLVKKNDTFEVEIFWGLFPLPPFYLISLSLPSFVATPVLIRYQFRSLHPKNIFIYFSGKDTFPEE